MASKNASRTFQNLVRRSRPACKHASSRFPPSASCRQFSASIPVKEDVKYETEKAERPRWSYTPERMKQPYPVRLRDTEVVWECNSDPAKLDRFYVRFLGPGGDKLLSEEIKWLAITHKSFDNGRRGFNDRLAFLGRRILNLQTNLALLHSTTATQTQIQPDESDDRETFTHPALEGLANLTNVPMAEILEKSRLGGLATQMGMREILRWIPRRVDKLQFSGIDTVMTSSIYAIIGAVALEKGGDVAAELAREKVLKPLGIR